MAVCGDVDCWLPGTQISPVIGVCGLAEFNCESVLDHFAGNIEDVANDEG